MQAGLTLVIVLLAGGVWCSVAVSLLAGWAHIGNRVTGRWCGVWCSVAVSLLAGWAHIGNRVTGRWCVVLCSCESACRLGSHW